MVEEIYELQPDDTESNRNMIIPPASKFTIKALYIF